MRYVILAGITLVFIVVVAVNLLANPQTLDTNQMQTMYGGVCYDKSEVFTEGCSPTWTCSSKKREYSTDRTSLGTQEINVVDSGYKRYESRQKDKTCKITEFSAWSTTHQTCSQRKRPSTYDKGPKYTMRGGSCYAPDNDDN